MANIIITGGTVCYEDVSGRLHEILLQTNEATLRLIPMGYAPEVVKGTCMIYWKRFLM
jgi:hypothetical protein